MSYRTVFDTMLPDAVHVADPFDVVRTAITAVVSAVGGYRTRPSVTAAASRIRSTGLAAC